MKMKWNQSNNSSIIWWQQNTILKPQSWQDGRQSERTDRKCQLLGVKDRNSTQLAIMKFSSVGGSYFFLNCLGHLWSLLTISLGDIQVFPYRMMYMLMPKCITLNYHFGMLFINFWVWFSFVLHKFNCKFYYHLMFNLYV
jgi:hypothetical protein